MIDVNDEKIRDQQKRFIEVLLIIGGIIGGMQLKDTASLNPKWSGIIYLAWGTFLVGSLQYYIVVSNLQKSDFFFLTFFSSIFAVAFGFTIIILLPFINAKIPEEGMIGMGLFTFIFVIIALYEGREKS